MPDGKAISDAIKASNSITYKVAFDAGHWHGRAMLQRDIDKAINRLSGTQLLKYSELAIEDGADPGTTPGLTQYLRVILHMALNDVLWDLRDKEAEAKFADTIIDPSRAGVRKP